MQVVQGHTLRTLTKNKFFSENIFVCIELGLEWICDIICISHLWISAQLASSNEKEMHQAHGPASLTKTIAK